MSERRNEEEEAAELQFAATESSSGSISPAQPGPQRHRCFRGETTVSFVLLWKSAAVKQDLSFLNNKIQVDGFIGRDGAVPSVVDACELDGKDISGGRSVQQSSGAYSLK